ncbi:thymidylate synthase, flavin-dependent [Solidesulfovibrio carbinoliphilus subsp. oakridgensis]|uniref:Flavin-dependent thymidylate synthase n=1 Tax=Solidesulfovibrio carbinoliphilus subsp. oakridgensis TaxID=694327 RepID=G7Q7E0_9BACT|nr:FAD-dependent thymidylate synthase [Solidesulfovibrio carbinoliphilus]EHJ49651.1 thymidylate synthase, flavin-dependent [Solidesulfovibrio carbinoliphilus subsp. oakridgensis]
MPQTTLAVTLLAHTPDALSLIYAAFRQCYHPGYVADMWPRLLSGDIPGDRQAEFVSRILASGHESPIEHVSFTFAVAGVSRALSHQLVRHRIASYSQQSQRYVDAASFDYVLPPAVAAIPEAKARFEAAMEQAGAAYAELQEILGRHGRAGKANEDARFVLPNACETKVVVTMNCRSLLHFFELRCCTRAQWEIRAMALAMLGLCREALPVIFGGAGARCERLGYCPEDERFTCGRYPRRFENPQIPA